MEKLVDMVWKITEEAESYHLEAETGAVGLFARG